MMAMFTTIMLTNVNMKIKFDAEGINTTMTQFWRNEDNYDDAKWMMMMTLPMTNHVYKGRQ